MQNFIVCFNGEPQQISIEAASQDEALKIAKTSFRAVLGRITLQPFEVSIGKAAAKLGALTSPKKAASSAANGKKGGRPAKESFPQAGGFRDFGKRVLVERAGRLGIELAGEGADKFVCVDPSDQSRKRLRPGQEITLRFCWDNTSANSIEWWEFETSKGTIYQAGAHSKNEISLTDIAK